ncbi:flavin reductase family protein [Nocardia gipuzkoensis]
MGVHQATLATAFARQGPDKFDGTAWTVSQHPPRLPDSAAWVAAEVDQYVTAGDHTVLLAHVTAAEAARTTRAPFPTTSVPSARTPRRPPDHRPPCRRRTHLPQPFKGQPDHETLARRTG